MHSFEECLTFDLRMHQSWKIQKNCSSPLRNSPPCSEWILRADQLQHNMSYSLTWVEVNKAACPPASVFDMLIPPPCFISWDSCVAFGRWSVTRYELCICGAAIRDRVVAKQRIPGTSQPFIPHLICTAASLPVNKTYPSRTLINSAPQRRGGGGGAKPLYLAEVEGASAYSQVV